MLIQVYYQILQQLKLEKILHQLYRHLQSMISILEMHYLIHIQVIMHLLYGILSSTGFKVTGSDLEQFLDDDGSGNVRRYYYLQVLEHIQILHKVQLIIQWTNYIKLIKCSFNIKY